MSAPASITSRRAHIDGVRRSNVSSVSPSRCGEGACCRGTTRPPPRLPHRDALELRCACGRVDALLRHREAVLEVAWKTPLILAKAGIQEQVGPRCRGDERTLTSPGMMSACGSI